MRKIPLGSCLGNPRKLFELNHKLRDSTGAFKQANHYIFYAREQKNVFRTTLKQLRPMVFDQFDQFCLLKCFAREFSTGMLLVVTL
jgi:hypothetical protein